MNLSFKLLLTLFLLAFGAIGLLSSVCGGVVLVGELIHAVLGERGGLALWAIALSSLLLGGGLVWACGKSFARIWDFGKHTQAEAPPADEKP